MSAVSTDITAEEIRECQRRHPRIFHKTVWEKTRLWMGWSVTGALVIYCLVVFDFSPARIWEGLDKLGIIAQHMFPPTANGAMGEFLYACLETLAMAFLGTFLAATVAIPLGCLASKNILPAWLLHFGLRRYFDFLRGVDALVWALIFVRAVGLGPLSGILAIAIVDTGTLAKLFSEAIENIDGRSEEGVRASGANKVQVVRFAILPQVLPMMLSTSLYLFESNTRSATILGIVGAGGIGFQLADRIRAHRWDEVTMIIILILILVYAIDILSKAIRTRFIQGETRPLVGSA